MNELLVLSIFVGLASTFETLSGIVLSAWCIRPVDTYPTGPYSQFRALASLSTPLQSTSSLHYLSQKEGLTVLCLLLASSPKGLLSSLGRAHGLLSNGLRPYSIAFGLQTGVSQRSSSQTGTGSSYPNSGQAYSSALE